MQFKEGSNVILMCPTAKGVQYGMATIVAGPGKKHKGKATPADGHFVHVVNVYKASEDLPHPMINASTNAKDV